MHELLNCYSVLTTSIFFDSSRCILVCSLNLPVLLAVRFCNIDFVTLTSVFLRLPV